MFFISLPYVSLLFISLLYISLLYNVYLKVKVVCWERGSCTNVTFDSFAVFFLEGGGEFASRGVNSKLHVKGYRQQ